jgi:cell division transport system permease protein
MKLFKTHFSVVFSLFVLLCSFQFIIFVDKIITEYEGYLADDYSIVVVAGKALDKDEIIKEKPIIKSIEELNPDSILDRLKSDISLPNMELLQKAMPKFYTIKLDKFPSSSVANSLKNDLLKKPSITQVEVFAKTYNKIYYVLKLMNFIITIFVLCVAVTSLLLVEKQMQIWTYEHSERIYIMDLFGASLWKKSAPLYKSAMLDSLLAAFLSICVFVAISELPYMQNVFAQLGINAPKFLIYKEGAFLVGSALFIAIASATLAIFKVRRL